MKTFPRLTILSFALLALLGTCPFAQADTETIVLIRHGEKPVDKEIGDLNEQGLNRALALAEVLPQKFPHPNYLFAPGTTDKIKKQGVETSYLRPLITLAPTAIRLGLPINTDFGFLQIAPLETELLKAQYQNSLIYVAWEHNKLRDLVAQIVSDLHSAEKIPGWPHDDYDSIYVLTIDTEGANRSVKFRIDHEGIKPGMGEPMPDLAK